MRIDQLQSAANSFNQIQQLHTAMAEFCNTFGPWTEVASQLQRYLWRTYPPVSCPGAQCGEDEVLAKLLPGEKGLCVDVGAAHPVECSNTWAFHERGWRTLALEPLIECFPAWDAQRPGDVFRPLAVMDYDGLAQVRVQGSVSTTTGESNVQENGRRIVTCKRLSTLLDERPGFRSAQLLSIDVEGAEREVLLGNDWSTFAPKVIVIEYRRYNPHELGEDVSGAWREIVTKHGYREVHKTDLNIIFQRGE